MLSEFDGKPVKSVARGELEIEDDEDETTERADIGGLGPWLEGLFAGKVAGVRTSGRLTDSACVLVDDDSGLSANMERLLKAARHDGVPSARRFLELNTRHPLIKDLATLHEQGKQQIAEPIAHLLLDDALLLEGVVQDPADMAAASRRCWPGPHRARSSRAATPPLRSDGERHDPPRRLRWQGSSSEPAV